MKKTVMTAMSFLVALSLCGAEKTLHYSAPITESPPVIDGKILPGEWRDSLSFDGMRHASGGKLPRDVFLHFKTAALDVRPGPGGNNALRAGVF